MNSEKVKFLLSWNHFAEHLTSCMTKLMTDSSYSDIIIATADKRMIYSHRFVLANSSKYFQRLLKHMNMQKGIKLVVALPEIKYEIFKILMNYMYKGETQVPHELLPSVVKAGQFLEINGLVNLNESDSGSSDAATQRSSSGEESQSRSSSDVPKGRISTLLRDKIQTRETTNTRSKSQVRVDKSLRRRGSGEPKTPELSGNAEKEKENHNKVAKTPKNKDSCKEKKDFIQLPLKRKLVESDKKSSSSEPVCHSDNDSSAPKKLQKTFTEVTCDPSITIKHEEDRSPSPLKENEGEDVEEIIEKITIKVEAPDVEEDLYNELQCEYCHEVYANPTEWVRHMTEQHGDRGYQAYKELDKTVSSEGSAVMTCVICSYECFSAAEWAKHLQMWHTEKELALANMSEGTKPKKQTRKYNKGPNILKMSSSIQLYSKIIDKK